MLSYLMTRQQDSVGLTTFDTEIGSTCPPAARRGTSTR